MRTVLCTGSDSQQSALLAATTASAAAHHGIKTLLASIGPVHGVSALLGAALTSDVQTIAPQLDAWVLDPAGDLRTVFERIRPQLFGSLAQLSGDELPLALGVDFFLSLERLRQTATSDYHLIVVDAGAHDALLRVLALPDSFRWITRLVFGLDRGPGKSNSSVNRALVPTSFLPMEWISAVQEARVRFETARNDLLTTTRTTIRYGLAPTRSAFDEARLALPALHLNELVVDSLIVGPLLPTDVADIRLAELVQQQQALLAETAQLWNSLPILALPLTTVPTNVTQSVKLGHDIYAEYDILTPCEPAPPLKYGTLEEPSVAIRLPGVPRQALSLTLSGDELVIRIGGYRRHLLLPESMRGKTNVKARREGEWLIVRVLM